MEYSREELATIEKTLKGIEEQMQESDNLKKAYSMVADGKPYDETMDLEISIAMIYLSLKDAYIKQAQDN